jgi:hypothetical protein
MAGARGATAARTWPPFGAAPPGCGLRAVMSADAGDLRRCRGRLLRLVMALNARSPAIYPKERWAGAACCV